MYHGRFAPSPTGALHIGSLLTAVASFLDARANQGFWHLRIDDLDTPRNAPGAADRILKTLESAGLCWDGPVRYQSRHLEQYRTALEDLEQQRLLYACACSRKELSEFLDDGSEVNVYPGMCRGQDRARNRPHAIRILARDTSLAFDDRLQGPYAQNLARACGDFVLKRRDGIVAYQLAVVIDDANQMVNQVVRGCDLLESTPRQIYLHTLLNLPVPAYCHLPLLADRQGIKLSKQTGAKPVGSSEVSPVVFRVLELLGHPPPAELKGAPSSEILQWAIRDWNPNKIPRCPELRLRPGSVPPH